MVQIRHGKLLARLCCLILAAGFLCGCHALTKGGKQEFTASPCVALALPASGPYAAVAGKIKRGANAAVAELKSKGINPIVMNIDTSKANWTQLAAQLPEAYAVVGGPLGEANYVTARKAGLLDKRMFFPFTPTLAQGDEGKRAWRFFPSPQDQIDALVNCATDKLNIRSFGAFYPDDAYGRRMAGLLENTLARKQITLQKAPYNPKAPASWSAAVRPLVNPDRSGNAAIPRTNFEALFVPDSWKNMPMVSTSLLDNGEDRLVLLGTTLWEQGMKGKGRGKVALGIFPMAWNGAKAPAAIRNGGDFWTALGYDFMKFASLMGLASKPESNSIALSRIQKASGGISVLAPMHWDSAGIAHQELYIYQIGPGGAAPLNTSAFQQSRQAVAEQAALRMQTQASSSGPAASETAQPVSHEYSSEGQSSQERGIPQETTPTPAPAPVQDKLPTIESVPHTSYKLSLPVKR